MNGTSLLKLSPLQTPGAPIAGVEAMRLGAAAAGYAAAGQSDSTRRSYQSSWRLFAAWCREHGAESLPAHALTVALYLTDRAPTRSVATLSVHLAAIRHVHFQAQLPPPASAELARIWSGIRRTHGAPPIRKQALVVADLRKVIARLPATMAGTRDKALLLIGFAGALRRSELVALELDHGPGNRGGALVEFLTEGITISIGHSKTDQLRVGQMVAIPFGKTKLCPVTALNAWLERAAITAGPIFRPVDRNDLVGPARLTAGSVARIVKRAVKGTKLDPALFAGHSLRAGLVTSAAAAKVPMQTIMATTRHAKVDTVLKYIRVAGMFEDNAAGAVGL